MSTKSALVEVKNGAFARTESVHRDTIGSPAFPPESGRYALIVSYACPWANRCIIVRSLYGLEKVVPMYAVHPTWQKTKPDVDEHSGWVFVSPNGEPLLHPSGENKIDCDEFCVPPPTELNWTSARSVYDTAGAGNAKKYTVPILFDLSTNKIVNNESSEIIKMLYDPTMLGQFATKNQSLNLYPSELASEIEDVNNFVYPQINNGVYKCGFAHSQEAYEAAAYSLKDGLERVEAILSSSEYIAGNVLTEADIRLFVTLIRHDEVYVVYFKCNHVPIIGGNLFPNIVRYMKLMMSNNDIRIAINMDHIKYHYYTSHPGLNPYGVVPIGPNVLGCLLK